MDSETHQSTVTLRLQAPAQKIVAPTGVAACELSWELDPEPVDESLDQRVIDCLSEIFCAFGTFAFVSDMPHVNESFFQRIKARLWPVSSPIVQKGKNLYRRLHLPQVRSGTLWLVETAQADVAQAFFRIKAWHYAHCQAGYLRDAGAPPLSLSDREIQEVIASDSWEAMQRSLLASGSKAVCVPGHDGAWLKFVFLDAQAMHWFSEQLRICCAAHQVVCVSLSPNPATVPRACGEVT